MPRSVLIILVCCCSYCYAQLRPSCYELRWAFVHPFAALKVKKITKRCYTLYNDASLQLQLDSFASGGRLDAFRHVFFMAAYAQKIKAKKLRQLGRAHEKANYRQFLRSKQEEGETPDSLSSVMDLKNNELGLALGSQNKNKPLNDLKQLAIYKISSGHAFILKRNLAGHYVDCEEHELDLKAYAGKWSIPKCLVASDLP